jgi:EAL domain-containing protein (putative c-di-GMP-specific phosphodiesterase class I)
MHMSVVAEGIEEPRQIEALIDCGVTNGQGYVVSPPVAAKKFLALVADNRQEPVAGAAVRAA